MPSCAVPTCRSYSSGKKKRNNVRFHKFPNSERREDWVKACQIGTTVTNLDKKCVCSLHFREEDYAKNLTYLAAGLDTKIRRLEPDAVPSLNLPEPRIVKYNRKPKIENNQPPKPISEIGNESIGETSNCLICTNEFDLKVEIDENGKIIPEDGDKLEKLFNLFCNLFMAPQLLEEVKKLKLFENGRVWCSECQQAMVDLQKFQTIIDEAWRDQQSVLGILKAFLVTRERIPEGVFGGVRSHLIYYAKAQNKRTNTSIENTKKINLLKAKAMDANYIATRGASIPTTPSVTNAGRLEQRILAGKMKQKQNEVLSKKRKQNDLGSSSGTGKRKQNLQPRTDSALIRSKYKTFIAVKKSTLSGPQRKFILIKPKEKDEGAARIPKSTNQDVNEDATRIQKAANLDLDLDSLLLSLHPSQWKRKPPANANTPMKA